MNLLRNVLTVVSCNFLINIHLVIHREEQISGYCMGLVNSVLRCFTVLRVISAIILSVFINYCCVYDIHTY